MADPLVSVLIPTFNRPKWFREALNSVLAQTYSNIEIVICDDSTNDDTERLIQKYLREFPQIKYYHNETRLGQFDNDLKLFERAQGEYINYLMDDDLFAPTKIEKMMAYFKNDKEEKLALITSRRHIIDGNGKIQDDIPQTRPVFDRDMVIIGRCFADYMMGAGNCMGEPTTVLFRKKYLKEPFGTFAGRRYRCNVDMATWLNLLLEGDMIYIAEGLSYFRKHPEQQALSDKMLIGGTIDYFHMVLYGLQVGLLQESNYRHLAIERANLTLKYLFYMVPRIAADYPDDITEIMQLKLQLEKNEPVPIKNYNNSEMKQDL
ncbi:glycosyltransferase family 2 protein [Hazenella sp. IB182357]|uniref:Glycosyltransferase family 2 protein n=1 Tax=Polycladospora coralii TaxID=2771432 RepID=A0A926RUX3_9BACL|nr:glycosyltransferase family 2 protein [Polycladospora coralii]MBD1373127.1 glycosyltransferase family 2 protein [Polycladospora coralii]MBS7531685.1 glycosyltransferase family 2 protein [Polycladospora coralii]